MKALLSLVPLLVGLTVGAQPAYLNYQGRLTDTTGQPLTGMKTLTFNIYSSALGGTPVWGPFLCDGVSSPGHTAQAYLNSDGRFNVILGDLDTNGRSVMAAFTNSVERYVEISVNGGPPIQPRQQFLSAPYALQSTKALQADVAASLVKQLADALCPPGTIVAFGGPTDRIPDGWLWCDGRNLTNMHYPKLYEAIGTSWGDGTYDRNFNALIPVPPVGTTFNLPDLRSLFLRGVSADLAPPPTLTGYWGDPDKASRLMSRPGAGVGNQVGSVQTNQVQPHLHQYSYAQWASYQGAQPIYDPDNEGDSATFNTVASTGNETRPKNAYVHYIIKY